MTIQVTPAWQPSGSRLLSQLHESIKHLDDRVVLTVVFVMLFLLNYAGNFFDPPTNISAFDNVPTHARTISGAEVLSFVAIAVVLKDLSTGRMLRWWDFDAIIGITVASIYPSPLSRAIAMTYPGILFIARSDKR